MRQTCGFAVVDAEIGMQRTGESQRGRSVVHAFGRFHAGLIAVFDAFFDGLDHVLIFEGGLDLGVGKIFDLGLFAHLGIAFAVGTVAFGAGFGIGFFDVSRRGGHGGHKYSRRTD